MELLDCELGLGSNKKDGNFEKFEGFVISLRCDWRVEHTPLSTLIPSLYLPHLGPSLPNHHFYFRAFLLP